MADLNFSDGDIVSSNTISVGKFVGNERMELAGSTSDFLKIYDFDKKMFHYIPENKQEQLRKLPKKITVKKYLDLFHSKEHIDVQEIEGSRYKYFKQKIDGASFKNLIEVLVDLSLLKVEGKLSVSEKKLMNALKEKIAFEASFILEVEQETVLLEHGKPLAH